MGRGGLARWLFLLKHSRHSGVKGPKVLKHHDLRPTSRGSGKGKRKLSAVASQDPGCSRTLSQLEALTGVLPERADADPSGPMLPREHRGNQGAWATPKQHLTSPPKPPSCCPAHRGTGLPLAFLPVTIKPRHCRERLFPTSCLQGSVSFL